MGNVISLISKEPTGRLMSRI